MKGIVVWFVRCLGLVLRLVDYLGPPGICYKALYIAQLLDTYIYLYMLMAEDNGRYPL